MVTSPPVRSAPSVLRGEIAEQPDVVARLLERERARVAKLGRALAKGHPAFVAIAARGSSDNAARYAQYAFGWSCRLPVALATPSLTTVYGRPPRMGGALVIGISQSGRSPDVVETIARARRDGARTLAIVNDTESPLARAAEELIPLHAGVEKSIAATKTYTAQLTAVALLAASIAGNRAALGELDQLPRALAKALESEGSARAAAKDYSSVERAIVIARGFHHATAHEIALKLKELALVPAEPYSAADFQHGPIAMAGSLLHALVVAPPRCAATPELRALVRELRARGSRVRMFGTGVGAVQVPALPEWISPIAAVVPGQWLALHAARVRGLDPDRPRGISKITETR